MFFSFCLDKVLFDLVIDVLCFVGRHSALCVVFAFALIIVHILSKLVFTNLVGL